jgi:autophagy-related protein 5
MVFSECGERAMEAAQQQGGSGGDCGSSCGDAVDDDAVLQASRRETWRGALPTIFTLAADEVTTLRPPRAFYKCLPRQSLLPFVCDVVHAHFAPFGPPMGGEIWFEYAQEPLRWQIPIGALYDLLVGEEAEEAALPWQITVHFQSFPSGTLFRSTRREAEKVLLNSLKESCYLRCGSAMPANKLAPADQERLAVALATADAAAYSEHYVPVERVLTAAIAQQLGRSADEPRAVPVRVFTSPTSWRQRPFAPMAPGGAGVPTTLGDVLAQLLPDHFGDAQPSSSSLQDTPVRVLVQGVKVPLHTPLNWLALACAHPDGWLYVSVRLPRQGE